MKHHLLALCFVSIACYANAQSDTTYFDMGRMKVKKEFTQTTTIKAKEIENIPSLSLSEIIRSRTSGSLTVKDQIVYVIDGITVADIDGYNIRNIEDITIVRNAAGNQNGAGNMQLLALIRTKAWNQHIKPIEFSAMGSGISRRANVSTRASNEQMENIVAGNFQQYTLTLRGGKPALNYGGSLAYMHDALPRRNKKDALYDKKIPGINRYKINLWGTTSIGKGTVLTAQLNYLPQTYKSHMQGIRVDKKYNHEEKKREYIINPYLNLKTRISGMVENKFSFNYLNGYTLYHMNARNQVSPNIFPNRQLHDTLKVETYMFSDNITLSGKIAGWHFEPSVNLFFQTGSYKTISQDLSYYENNQGISYSRSMLRIKSKLLTSTPSLSVSYKSLLLIQGGVLLDGSKIIDSDYKDTKVHPFINGSFNVTPLMKLPASMQWKIFASYSEQFYDFNAFYRLSDFSYDVTLPKDPPVSLLWGQLYRRYNMAKQWQLGSCISFMEERIKVNYNYMNAGQIAIERIFIGSPGNTMSISGEHLLQQHHVSVEAGLMTSGKLVWNTGLFMNLFRNSQKFDVNIDISNTEKPITGGLVNSFQYQQFHAGVDLLYLFNAETRKYSNGAWLAQKHNSLQITYAFIAYQFKPRYFDNAELFISCRNAADSKTYTLSPDNKKYFGGGFSVTL